MKRWIKEPLIHFLVAGGLLFCAYAWLNEGSIDRPRVVRITAAEVDWLREAWTRQWQRPPSDQDLRRLVLDYLKEDLLAREARALNLDQNDTVVRRRLAQKMEFLIQDTALLAEPGEEALRRYYETHRERFQTPARITFTHLYFNPDRRGKRTEEDARAALGQLSSGVARATDLGDRFLLQYDFFDTDELEVARVLGEQFARRVFALAPGGWQGPIPSGYGLHLVQVAKIRPARPHEFAAVKGEVVKQWREQREREAREQYLAALLQRYDVAVDESVNPLVIPLELAMEQED